MDKPKSNEDTFGLWKIIGDTEEKNDHGQKIYLARHLITGKVEEVIYKNLKNGTKTGYSQSLARYKNKNRADNKTGYTGLTFNKNVMRWAVILKVKNKKTRKTFKKFEDAVLYLNKIRMEQLNPLLFYEEEKIKKIKPSDIKRNKFVTECQKEIDQSIFLEDCKNLKRAKGYNWNGNKWRAYISKDKKQIVIGYFDTEEEAKAARKKAVDEQIKILKKQLEKDEL